MSQKSPLLNLTTKQCKNISNTAQKNYLLFIHAQVHDGNNGIMTLIFTFFILFILNICNIRKSSNFILYKLKLSINIEFTLLFKFLPELNYLM